MPDNDTLQNNELGQMLGIGKSATPPSRFKRWMPWIFAALILTTVALLLGRNEQATTVTYRTQPAQRGDLVVTVTATGDLQPTNQVEVGSELSGIVRSVEADYNDRVKVGQVLARLDTAKLDAQVVQARAALDSAKARVAQAQASATETNNAYQRLKKARKLSKGKLSSPQELEATDAARQRAAADLIAAKAAVAENRASLDVKETDLAKLVIYSPIDGIVLARTVEVGQTVAASLQAPVLFTLAEDLGKMELHVNVDEADVGKVLKGQTATFTVDAYPDRTFPALITQVRFGAQVVAGVVTYQTVLEVKNDDLTLRPGMTATADITVERLENIMLVPNAALRFTPPPTTAAKPGKQGGSLLSKLLPRRSHRSGKRPETASRPGRQQQVWILRDGEPKAINVTTGSTNELMTQLTSGEVKEGLELIVETENGTK
ncbi:MAG: efflux RND transporter periplasmic adaptor subunit [Desulfobulbaceae bacterium]|nr:efflux RND transporter periplasmic adaptor subunit [Desulfobulbaceae bacterium]